MARVVQVAQVIQVVSVVRMCSLDDMFSGSKPSNHRGKLRCHACDTRMKEGGKRAVFWKTRNRNS